MLNTLKFYFSLIAVLALALNLASCSGGGGGGESSSTPTINEFNSKLVAAYGGDGGTDAVLLALDRGYSLQQIVDAGLAGLLSSSGVVTDSGGATVAPDNSPVGNISRSSNDLAATSDVGTIRNWLKTKAEESGYGNAEGIGTIFLVAMVLDGYDYEQIYEAFLFGYSFARTCKDGRYHVTIVDERGNDVNPANPTGYDHLEPERCEETTGGDSGGDTGGDTGNVCYLDNTSILGTWSNPRVYISSSSWIPACSRTFVAGGTVVNVCEGQTTSSNWSLDCNTLTLGSVQATVTSASSFWYTAAGGVTVTVSR